MESINPRNVILRYGCAIVSIALAVSVRLYLDPVLGNTLPYATLFVAVMLTAWYGGLLPAILAVGLGALAANFFLLPTRSSLVFASLDQQVGLLLYLAAGLGIALIGGAMHTARRRAETSAAALVETNEQLEERVRERTAEMALTNESIRTSEARMGGIVNSAMDAIISVDASQHIVLFNAAAEKIFRCSAAKALGQSLDLFIPERFRKEHQRHIKGFGTRNVTSRSMLPLGSPSGLSTDCEEFPIEASISQVEVGDEKIFTIILRDITERKLAEDSLRESEHRYRSLFENMIEGYAYCQMLFDHETPSDFVYIAVNSKFERLTGLKDVVGKKVSEVIPGFQETSSDLIKLYGRVALTGKPERLETFVESLGIWFSIAVYSPAKEYFIAIFDNITERKQAEVDLRERIDLQEQIAQIAATSPGVLYSFRLLPDGSHCFPYASPAVVDLFGLQAKDLERDGSELFAKVHPEDIDNVQASIAESARTFLPWSNEFRCFHPDRGEVWVVANSVPQREPDGSILWRGFAMDITGRKRSEADLVRLAAAVQQTADSVVITDPEGNIQYVNPAFERTTGYAKEEVLGRNSRFLKSGQTEAAVYKELWETISLDEVWVGQLTNRKKDGTLFDENVTISPVHDKNQRIVNYIAVKQDISDFKHLEEQLRQAQKMEAVGQLAGGIAHDFNNLLTVITGYSDLSIRKLQPEDPLRRNLEEIKKAGDRASSLTRQLLAFSRKQVLQPKVLDLNAVVAELKKMIGRLIGEDIELRTIAGCELGSVKADPGQIEQVIMNLAVNARDAMPRGGKLTIETEAVYLSDKNAEQHIVVSPGHYVMLAVSDTGIGMDEKTKERIFEPFFTTKGVGKGTGLGLSTVYGIVNQSGGYIWVYSEVGQGTTFKIYLPQVGERAQEYERDAEARDAVRGTETILLAEDEEMVRKLALEVLESYGYRVLMAASGGAALLVCERHKERIHLLITDVVMPEMSGRELSDRLAQIRPEMKVLYMSGYTDNAIVHQGILDAGAHFIQKPFSPNVLARKVREILDA